MPKKKDFILIGVLLVIALIGLGVTQFLQHQTGASVTITIGGEIYGTYPLDQSRTIEINDAKGYNKVVIEMAASHGGCRLSGSILCPSTQPFMPGHETIICLPHELVVEITGGEVSDVDVVTQ